MTAPFRLYRRIPLSHVFILLLLLISCTDRSPVKVFDVHLHVIPMFMHNSTLWNRMEFTRQR